jgi:hypothetical protein
LCDRLEPVSHSFNGAPVLATDELLFLAEFLNSCTLTGSTIHVDKGDAIRHRQNRVHKLMVLSEFAGCCGFMVTFR